MNKRPFSYCIDSEKHGPEKCVFLDDYDMKEYYFYYNIALTYYLLGDENKAVDYLTKARALNLSPNSESKVKKLVNLDLNNLKKVLKTHPEIINQPELINRTIEFQNKFVSLQVQVAKSSFLH